MSRVETIRREAEELAYWQRVASILGATVTDEWDGQLWCKVALPSGALLNVTQELAEILLGLVVR